MPAAQTAILHPVLVLAALTFAIALRMLAQRIVEMRTRRIHPRAMATSAVRAQRLQATTGADNFANLFELPVLFYVLCLALLLTQRVTDGFLWAAWAFVALRVLHSLIHVTYNNVIHRFAAYGAGYAVLAGMWAGFALALL